MTSIADLGFTRREGGGGANTWEVDKNLLFGKIVAENCMKIKEIRPGERFYVPLGSANAYGSTRESDSTETYLVTICFQLLSDGVGR